MFSNKFFILVFLGKQQYFIIYYYYNVFAQKYIIQKKFNIADITSW